ncbi:hypothetical protein NSP34_25460, partial [Salmonella enterica]|nr:hypothetical protein [Salmonella enterica]
ISPFAIEPPTDAWEASLHSFGWLRNMRAAGTELAMVNARALVEDWIRMHGKRIEGIAWSPEITAQRIIAWLQHSNIILATSDLATYRK